VPAKLRQRYYLAGHALYQMQDGLNMVLDVGDCFRGLDLFSILNVWHCGLLPHPGGLLSSPDFIRTLLHLPKAVKPKTRQRFKLPPLRSTLLPDAGYAFLRPAASAAAPKGTVLLFDCGPHGHYHGHYDRLAVTLTAQGRALLPDPGYHPYDSSATRFSVLSTLWHSTLCLDAQNYCAREDDETGPCS
jgi:hypothetical protein